MLVNAAELMAGEAAERKLAGQKSGGPAVVADLENAALGLMAERERKNAERKALKGKP